MKRKEPRIYVIVECEKPENDYIEHHYIIQACSIPDAERMVYDYIKKSGNKVSHKDLSVYDTTKEIDLVIDMYENSYEDTWTVIKQGE